MIKLDLSINEVNAILLSLAKLPFETVAPLIEKIREQSLPQVPEEDRNDGKKAKLKSDLLKTVETLTPDAE
jgi:hypothetical protein